MRGAAITTMLRSQIAVLTALALALAAQVPHAASVFMLIAQENDPTIFTRLHSYSYAIALEIAVLLFVVHGMKRESYTFALVSILVNLSYYGMSGVNLFSLNAFPAYLIGISLPSAIALYSHVVVYVEHSSVDRYTVDQTEHSAPLASVESTIARLRTAQVHIAHVHTTQIDNAQNEIAQLEVAQFDPEDFEGVQSEPARLRNPSAHYAEFNEILQSGSKYNLSELARRWSVAPNTLRNWRNKIQGGK